MSHHASFTYAGLLTAGGIFGYAKTKSVPSLVAGVVLGSVFAFSGYLIKEKQEHYQGHLLASAAALAMVGAGLSRYSKTSKKTVPVALISLGAVQAAYQINKAVEWKGA